MHELGLLSEIVTQIEQVAAENNVTKIAKLVVEVGEFSGVIPSYLKECYPAVIEDTILEHTELVIETVKGRGHCNDCGADFDLVERMPGCPECKSPNCVVTEGANFIIKEIVVIDGDV